MITNGQNNVIIVEACSGGHVMLNLFKNIDEYNEYTNPVEVIEPIEGEEPLPTIQKEPIKKQDIPFFIGKRLDEAKKSITSLSGGTMETMEKKLLEEIILETLIEDEQTFKVYSFDGTDLKII